MLTPYSTLGQAFRAVAETHGQRPALRLSGGETVSFAALEALANRLAHLLAASGIGCGQTVALQHSKRVEGYAAMLACLKLGAAYVNLDEKNPASRLESILATSRPNLLAADAPLADTVALAAQATGLPTLVLPQALAGQALDETPPEQTACVSDTSLAYIMFTSGSTGTPKGVRIPQANVLRFAAWAKTCFRISPGDTLTNLNPVYFDNSVFDFYGSLLNGAALAPIPPAVMHDPRAIVAAVEDQAATLWFSVPSLLVYLLLTKALDPDRLAGIRTFIFGGEGFPKPALRRLHALYGHRARLINVYGPTECTCICSAHAVTVEDLEDERLAPLGRLAPDFTGLVLDEEDRENNEGELCLLGPQLGLGYCGDPERTAQSFVASPKNGAPMYRTGDMVRREPSGQLRFLCRKDNQIKHMGYRIELDEVEAAVNALDRVRLAAVVHVTTQRGLGKIVAFVTTYGKVAESQLREALGTRLPAYMIPTVFVNMAPLPQNANGKLDRRKLATLAEAL